MDVSGQHPCVCVKRKYVQLIFENAEHIRTLFGLRVCEKTVQKQDVSKLGFTYLPLQPEQDDRIISVSELSKVQGYVDSLCGSERDERVSCGGEDSSYDSDYEAEDSQSHQDVSRTVSDTLGAEFAEYVSTPDPGYTARVEFGLKLGYTERLVQAALQKLGPNPEQNELLEELIKLGAQASRHQDPGLDGPDEVAEGATLDPLEDVTSLLRPVVIDGSNVAMSHGNKKVFSCQGIKLCVDWFRARGHKQITVFVPKWRKEASRPDNPITDQEILTELEKERSLVFTPSRLIGGKRMVCYDDRYILRLAAEEDGIVVSNDNYRDLAQESPEFRRVVEERILMYSFVNDRFMPPDDPLGRGGPTLENFLRMQPRKGDPPPPCPYGKKCTYGNKCKFHHPERGPLPHKSVSERLAEQAQKHLQARGIHSRDSSPGGHLKGGKSLSLPLPCSPSQEQDSKLLGAVRKMPLARTKSNVPGLSLAVQDCEVQGGQSNVPKSHSVENVACYQHVSAPAQSTYGLWMAGSTQYSASPPMGLASHVTVTSRLSDPETSSEQGVNLHRKLQRQLTLNPACDPRLNRMYVSQQQRQAPQPPPYTPMSSWEHHHQQHQQQMHQSVTRIASAPDSYRPWPPSAPPIPPGHMHRLSSTSDPQLNLCVPPAELMGPDPFDTGAGGVWPPTTSAPPPSVVWPPQPQVPQFAEDARGRLHYHLASIFPEEQVKKAMQFYPDETNPQKICAAILAMFPKP